MPAKLPLGRWFGLFDMELIQPKSTEDRARRRVAIVSLQANDNCLRRFERVEGKAQGVPRGRCCLKIHGLSEELISVRIVDEEHRRTTSHQIFCFNCEG